MRVEWTAWIALALLMPLAAARNVALYAAAPTPTVVAAADLDRAGLQLLHTYFKLVPAVNGTDSMPQPALFEFLDPAYQVVRGDGGRQNRTTFIAMHLSVPVLSDLHFELPAPHIIAALYNSTVNSSLQGVQFSTDTRPRLTVFRRDEATGSWKALAHANFNLPALFLCQPPQQAKRSPPPVNPDTNVTALATRVMRQVYAELERNGVTDQVFNPRYLVQTADGSSFIGAADAVPFTFNASAPNLEDLYATRNGDSMVVTYYSGADHIRNPGHTYINARDMAPSSVREVVLLRDGDPTSSTEGWRVITWGSFHLNMLPSSDPACSWGSEYPLVRNGHAQPSRPPLRRAAASAAAAALLGAGALFL